MRISDWSSDVCSSDLLAVHEERRRARDAHLADGLSIAGDLLGAGPAFVEHCRSLTGIDRLEGGLAVRGTEDVFGLGSSLRMNAAHEIDAPRSEERRVGKECVSTCRSGCSAYH